MEIKADDRKSDCLACVYRCALMIARDRWELALEFWEKAKSGLDLRLDDKLLENYPSQSEQRLVMAEKVLDEYMRLKKSNT